jgi:predicted dehydrogenase
MGDGRAGADMIGVAMLGFWHLHAADYARELDAHPGAELRAIWDDDHARGRAEAEARAVAFVADLDELLADDSIAGVVVDTATADHERVIVASARAGKHVFTEKVLAATLDGARRIVDEVERAGVTLTTCMRRTHDGAYADVGGLLDSGAVGRVTAVRVRDGHPFALATDERPDGRLPPQFWHPGDALGGIMIDLCHPIYLILGWLGLPSHVSATTSCVTGHELEDNGVVTMRYDDGTIAVAETTSVSAVTPFSIEVHGTTGSITYTEPGIGEMVARDVGGYDVGPGPDGLVRRWIASPGEPPGWAATPPTTGHPTAFEHWIECIEAGRDDADNVALALRLTAVVEASYRSAAERRTVAIDEIWT